VAPAAAPRTVSPSAPPAAVRAPSEAPGAALRREPRPALRAPPPPEAEEAGPALAGEVRLRRPPAWKRAAAWGIDAVPLAVLGVLVARPLFAGAAPADAGIDGALDFLARERGVVVPLAAFLALAALVYVTLSHALMGATIGKALLRLRVVAGDGERPTWRRSTARSAAMILSAALLGLGFLLALFSRSGRALHDWIAGTYVVERS
jgi:uncharacterized RDD family membrane protein YckC